MLGLVAGFTQPSLGLFLHNCTMSPTTVEGQKVLRTRFSVSKHGLAWLDRLQMSEEPNYLFTIGYVTKPLPRRCSTQRATAGLAV